MKNKGKFPSLKSAESLGGMEEKAGGEGEIRTLGEFNPTHDFQSCTFSHSVTSPAKAKVIISSC
jgi:hypothetical protein